MARNAERALVKRINRRLAKEGEQLHSYSGSRWYSDLGNFYITNENNVVVGAHFDLATLAKEIGCPLKDYRPAAETTGE